MKLRVLALSLLLSVTVSGCASESTETIGRGDLTFEELTQLPDYETLVSESCDAMFKGTIQNLEFLAVGEGELTGSVAQVMASRTNRLEDSLMDEKELASILDEARSWNSLVDGQFSDNWTNPSQFLEEAIQAELEETLLPPLLQGEEPKSPETLKQISEDWIQTCDLQTAVSEAREITNRFELSLSTARENFKKPFLESGYQDFTVALAKLDISGGTASVKWVGIDGCTPEASLIVKGKPDADGISPSDETVKLLLQHSKSFVAVTSKFDIKKEMNRDLSKYEVSKAVLASIACF